MTKLASVYFFLFIKFLFILFLLDNSLYNWHNESTKFKILRTIQIFFFFNLKIFFYF